jgi:predicted metal-dependent hydrolase
MTFSPLWSFLNVTCYNSDMGKEIDFEYTITKKVRRRSVGITITPDRKVSVVAPYYVSKKNVHSIVIEKATWIRKKLNYFLENKEYFKPKTFSNNESFYFLGQKYPLNIKYAAKKSIELIDSSLQVSLPLRYKKIDAAKYIKSSLEKWFREKMEEILDMRVPYFNVKVDGKISSVKTRALKQSWGSCSQKGDLTFNWQLVTAPSAIIDYVVVHELCHLIHLNHSKDFWNTVESLMPDYKKRRKWLKDNQYRLRW